MEVKKKKKVKPSGTTTVSDALIKDPKSTKEKSGQQLVCPFTSLPERLSTFQL